MEGSVLFAQYCDDLETFIKLNGVEVLTNNVTCFIRLYLRKLKINKCFVYLMDAVSKELRESFICDYIQGFFCDHVTFMLRKYHGDNFNYHIFVKQSTHKMLKVIQNSTLKPIPFPNTNEKAKVYRSYFELEDRKAELRVNICSIMMCRDKKLIDLDVLPIIVKEFLRERGSLLDDT